jgi:hypothetical protein
VTNIEGDFSFEDRNNYTFNIKVLESKAEGTIRIPKTFEARIELLNGSGFVQNIEIEVEVSRPKDQNEKPGFKLSCPKFNKYWNLAKKNEFTKLTELLPGYLIVLGSATNSTAVMA